MQVENGYLLGGEIGGYDPPYPISYNWIIKCKDYPPPKIEIIRPKNNYIYIFDREIMPFFTTIAIGDFTVKATSDNPDIIRKVEFYLRGIFVGYDYEPRIIIYSPPFQWKFDVFVIPVPFRPMEIMCVAYYGNSGAVAVDKIEVFITNRIIVIADFSRIIY